MATRLIPPSVQTAYQGFDYQIVLWGTEKSVRSAFKSLEFYFEDIRDINPANWFFHIAGWAGVLFDQETSIGGQGTPNTPPSRVPVGGLSSDRPFPEPAPVAGQWYAIRVARPKRASIDMSAVTSELRTNGATDVTIWISNLLTGEGAPPRIAGSPTGEYWERNRQELDRVDAMVERARNAASDAVPDLPDFSDARDGLDILKNLTSPTVVIPVAIIVVVGAGLYVFGPLLRAA